MAESPTANSDTSTSTTIATGYSHIAMLVILHNASVATNTCI